MTEYTYRVVLEPVNALSLSDLSMHDAVRGHVVREGGENGPRVVWSSRSYTGRKAKTTAKMRAGLFRKRYADYAEDHGECWAVEQAAERDAKHAQTIAEQAAAKAAREFALTMLAVLEHSQDATFRTQAVDLRKTIHEAQRLAKADAERSRIEKAERDANRAQRRAEELLSNA